MNQASFEVGNDRLLRLADLVERRGGYDQGYLFRAGEPSCALGIWLDDNTAHKGSENTLHAIYQCGGTIGYSMAQFCLTMDQAEQLFGAQGCGDARRDHHKAAAYIRSFVGGRKADANRNRVPMPEAFFLGYVEVV